MSGLSAMGHGGGASALARQLQEIATGTTLAANLAKGDYINAPSLRELQHADKAAGRAMTSLQDLLPEIGAHGGGDDGVRLARQAVEHIDAGREALREGVAVEDDVLRGGAAVIDQIATGSASALFDQAAFAVQGLADGAHLRSTPLEDIFAAVTRGLR